MVFASLLALIEHIHDLGLAVKLDTNGTNPNLIAELIDEKLIDYIAMDIKGPLDERYNKLVGVKADLNKVKKSIEIIMDSTVEYEFRTTVVPTLLAESDLEDISSDLNGAKKFVYQQFVPDHARDKKLRNIKPYSKEFFKSICKSTKKTIKNVVLRGVK
jgi:pyruvate formate lyase activating enzyme